MVYIENSHENYSTLKISIGPIIKKPEMLKFGSDHLKTKFICKNAVNKVPLVITYVPEPYQTQES